MCGIVGYIGAKKVVPVIIEGLRKLEYRGYATRPESQSWARTASYTCAERRENFTTSKK